MLVCLPLLWLIQIPSDREKKALDYSRHKIGLPKKMEGPISPKLGKVKISNSKSQFPEENYERESNSWPIFVVFLLRGGNNRHRASDVKGNQHDFDLIGKLTNHM